MIERTAWPATLFMLACVTPVDLVLADPDFQFTKTKIADQDSVTNPAYVLDLPFPTVWPLAFKSEGASGGLGGGATVVSSVATLFARLESLTLILLTVAWFVTVVEVPGAVPTLIV